MFEFSLFNGGNPEGIRLWLENFQTNKILWRAALATQGDEGMVWGLDLVSEEGAKTYDWRVAMRPLQRDFEELIEQGLIEFR